MSIERKVAIVTGASRGIGSAIAHCLSISKIADWVVGTATTLEGAEKITADFQAKNLPGCGLVLNLDRADSAANLVTQVTEQYGTPLILINNAGITRDNLLLRMSDQEWLEVIETNLNGTFRVIKACLRGMLKARWGRIVSLSSVSAAGNAGQTNYSASKGGIESLTRSLAREVATRAITVNAVAPGFIATDMTNGLTEKQREFILNTIPMGRIGTALEIAQVVEFLASDAASYLTGQVIHVNGGMY